MISSQNQLQSVGERVDDLSRRGLSLLEVVLALSILAMATAYLAQSMSIATTNAIRSERLTQAELVGESVMNQVIAGVIPAQPVTWTAYISASQQSMGTSSRWMYQLQSVQTEMEGMIGLQVAVQEISQDGLTRNNPDFFVNRWMIDPSLGLDTPPAETEEDAASTGSSSSSAGSTSGTSAGSSAGVPGAAGGIGALPPLGGVGGAGGRGGPGQGGPGGGGQGGPPGGGGGAGQGGGGAGGARGGN